MDDKSPTKAATITSLENLCVYGMQVCICVSAHMHVCMYVRMYIILVHCTWKIFMNQCGFL